MYIHPVVAKSELHEPGQAGWKGFEAKPLPSRRFQINSLSEVTKSELSHFP
jgi:hypothetical protein